MPDTVYFHIGSIKTGSTGVQKFCYEHRDALLAAGVDYIQFHPPKLHLPRWANADFLLQDGFDAAFVAARMAQSPAPSILISEEGLMGRPHIWQHPVFAGMRRVIVLYLRNSVDLVASWAAENSLPYNFSQMEHASGQGVVSVDEGLGIWSDQYRGMLFTLCHAFASDPGLEVLLRPFPPRDPQGEALLPGFLRTLGITDPATLALADQAGDEIVNQGQSRKYCDAAFLLSELVKQHGLSPIYDTHFVLNIAARLRSGDDRKVIQTLNRLEMIFVQQRLLPPVRQLQSMFGGAEGLDALPPDFHLDRAPYSRIDLRELQDLFFEDVLRQHLSPRLG